MSRGCYLDIEMDTFKKRYNDVYIKSIFTSIYDFRRKLKIEFTEYHCIKGQYVTNIRFIDINNLKFISWGGEFDEREIRILQELAKLVEKL